jgi:histone H1/5
VELATRRRGEEARKAELRSELEAMAALAERAGMVADVATPAAQLQAGAAGAAPSVYCAARGADAGPMSTILSDGGAAAAADEADEAALVAALGAAAVTKGPAADKATKRAAAAAAKQAKAEQVAAVREAKAKAAAAAKQAKAEAKADQAKSRAEAKATPGGASRVERETRARELARERQCEGLAERHLAAKRAPVRGVKTILPCYFPFTRRIPIGTEHNRAQWRAGPRRWPPARRC